jgi:organic radical activating enzyme
MIERDIDLSKDETFYTLQGEGDSIGKPATFIRLHYCNLKCDWCDTKYTWDGTEKAIPWDMGRLVREIISKPTKRVVITGGEPLIQQKRLASLVKYLPNYQFEIETNGTIEPILELESCQFNVSPKLANSGNPLEKRYKPFALKRFNELNTYFKFVVTSPKDLVEVELIVDTCDLDSEKIIIMPEGTTQEEIKEHALAVVEIVKEKGWRLVPRLQTMLWGKTRKV